MRRRFTFGWALLVVVAAWSGCRHAATNVADAGAPTPCANDGDCRVAACENCTCAGVHKSDPDPCGQAICTVWPCGGFVAVCDPGTRRCTSKSADGGRQ